MYDEYIKTGSDLYWPMGIHDFLSDRLNELVLLA